MTVAMNSCCLHPFMATNHRQKEAVIIHLKPMVLTGLFMTIYSRSMIVT